MKRKLENISPTGLMYAIKEFKINHFRMSSPCTKKLSLSLKESTILLIGPVENKEILLSGSQNTFQKM